MDTMTIAVAGVAALAILPDRGRHRHVRRRSGVTDRLERYASGKPDTKRARPRPARAAWAPT